MEKVTLLCKCGGSGFVVGEYYVGRRYKDQVSVTNSSGMPWSFTMGGDGFRSIFYSIEECRDILIDHYIKEKSM